MAGNGDGTAEGPGDKTSSDLSGHVDGHVFQGRDFHEINIGAQLPDEAVSYYRRMQERLDAEEREKRERREAEERSRRERAESARQARQEAWNQRWDALVAERAGIRKRVGGGFFVCGVSFFLCLVGAWIAPEDTASAAVVMLLLVASFVGFVVGAAGCFALDGNRRRMNAHKDV